MAIDASKQIISRLLTLQLGGEPDSKALAERSLWLWGRIATNLTPLIGEVGFQSLYARAVHLALPRCPGITFSKQERSTDGLFEGLRADLVALEYGIAEQCSAILLNEFTELVASMIGDVLMEQILRSAWEDQPPQANISELSNDQ